jgi:integrase
VKIAKLLPECQNWLNSFSAIALNTGLRVGEICALTWPEVDLKQRVINVRCDEDSTAKKKR